MILCVYICIIYICYIIYIHIHPGYSHVFFIFCPPCVHDQGQWLLQGCPSHCSVPCLGAKFADAALVYQCRILSLVEDLALQALGVETGAIDIWRNLSHLEVYSEAKGGEQPHMSQAQELPFNCCRYTHYCCGILLLPSAPRSFMWPSGRPNLLRAASKAMQS